MVAKIVLVDVFALSKYMAAILQLATNSITSTKSVNTISAATTNLYLFVECHVCAPLG